MIITSDHGSYNNRHMFNVEQSQTSFAIVTANFKSDRLNFSNYNQISQINQVDLNSMIQYFFMLPDMDCSWGSLPARMFNALDKTNKCYFIKNYRHLSRLYEKFIGKIKGIFWFLLSMIKS